MDIGRAFSFISEDERWLHKLGVGALLSMVPILNFVMFGYSIQVARNVAEGVERPLPEWRDFGKLFGDGLRMVGAYFAYLLPVFVLMIFAMIPVIISMESTDLNNPSSSAAPLPPAFIAFWLFYIVCIFPYTLLLYGILPLFGIQIARQGRIGACFQLKEMWRLVRAQPVNYILILVVMFGLYMAVSFVSFPAIIVAVLIPCLGLIIYLFVFSAAMLLMLMVVGHLQGQFIRADNEAKSHAAEFEPGLL